MKTLRERLTPAIIKALEERTRTNREVALTLGVHESYLCTVFNSISRKKRGEVTEQREAAQKLVESRRQLRLREARLILRGKQTMEKGAENANCSERTMRRYVERIAPSEPKDTK